MLSLLGWTRVRLDATLAAVAGQLETTALRVAVTDERLQLLLRADVLPGELRVRFERDRAAQRGLDQHLAVALLSLVREQVLSPFPDSNDGLDRADLVRTNLDPAYLVARRIAVLAPRHSPDQQHDPGLQIHPDVLSRCGWPTNPPPTQPVPGDGRREQCDVVVLIGHRRDA